MKRRLAFFVMLIFCVLTVCGCSRRAQMQGEIQIKGSDTMVNLGQAWAEAYQQMHPYTSISVTGGGSGTGIAALINKNASIAESSRSMKPEELAAAVKNGLSPQEFTVALDGVAVIVNKDNPVKKLTIDQLSKIYTGKITNWKQMGGRDEKIVPLSRDKSSGTHDFFLEHVLRQGNPRGQEEYAADVLMLVSSTAIASEVSANKGSIGYVGMGFADKSKHTEVAVAKSAASPYMEPTESNILNKTYPIARPLYFYTPGKPEGDVKGFIDFVLSDEGQRIVKKKEFVPVRSLS
ncbi:MAG: phosphate ABC transporter substrate-binding protein [Armatimonadota bacterium]